MGRLSNNRTPFRTHILTACARAVGTDSEGLSVDDPVECFTVVVTEEDDRGVVIDGDVVRRLDPDCPCSASSSARTGP